MNAAKMTLVTTIVGLAIGLVAAALYPLPAGADPGDTTRVSEPNLANQGTLGTEGDDESLAPAISADGRYVAFDSKATNLVLNDTVICLFVGNCSDVFVHDRQTGITTRVSVPNLANQGTLGTEGDGFSRSPSISADGRYVAFNSGSSNLVLGGDGFSDVYVHDRQTGATTQVSVDSAGTDGNNVSGAGTISANGRFVAFESSATNLLGVLDTNGFDDIFVHDRDTDTTTRVSVPNLTDQGILGSEGDDDSGSPAGRGVAISADGRYVAFESFATNLVVGDANGDRDVFVHDRDTGTTTRVSVDSAGIGGNDDSLAPDISDNGRYVAFESSATNLVLNDTLFHDDVFVHDRNTGTTTRVSVDSAGNQGFADSSNPAISGSGLLVAFQSRAANLVVADNNVDEDVFVHDRLTGITTRVSVDSAGTEGDDSSSSPAISGLGRFVAYSSLAINLVGIADTNSERDIFVHELLLCGGLLPTILGTSGDDPALMGTAGPDVIHGLAGDDTIIGDDGIDFICGGDDQDILFGDGGNDVLFGGDGVDFLFGGIDNDLLFGGLNMDSLFGEEGNDALFGGEGMDDLHGGIGEDLLVGGAGIDNLNGDEDNDRLFGNGEDDGLNGGDGDDKLFGGPDNDLLRGNADNDFLFGGVGLDVLDGGDGDDKLFGNAGDDELNGDAGDDKLFGGFGADDLDGGADVDRCNGGFGILDTATAACETQISIP